MTTNSDVNAARIAALEEKVAGLQKELNAFETRDRQRVHAALVMLGGVVLTLGSFIISKIDVLLADVISRGPK